MNWGILVLILLILAAGTSGYLFITGGSGDYTKILVITLHVGNAGVRPVSEEIRYGHAPVNGLQSGAWKGQLLDTDGKILREFGVWDPRVQFGDSVMENGSIRGNVTISDAADLNLVLPYTEKEERFVLSDTATGVKLADVSLAGAAAVFNSTYPDDPDSTSQKNGQGSPSSLAILAGGCILMVLLIVVILNMLRGK